MAYKPITLNGADMHTVHKTPLHTGNAGFYLGGTGLGKTIDNPINLEMAELECMLAKAEQELASLPLESEPHVEQLKARNYQLEDVAFHVLYPKSANHSQPGIGKTAIAILTQIHSNSRNILVSCPNYLTQQWKEEIERWVHSDDPNTENIVFLCTGSKMDRIQAMVQCMLPEHQSKRRWTIINHQMARTYPIPAMFDSLIIDEAHHFANRTAKMSKNMIELAKNTPRVLQLTATPVRKEPDDLFSQLQMLDPHRFTSYSDFVSEYCYVTSGRFGYHVRGGRTKKIQEMLQQYAVAHTYHSVHLQLPKLIEYVDSITLPREVANQYLAVRNSYRYQDLLDAGQVKFLTNAMQVMQHLRKITMCDEKLEAIKEIVESQSEPCVIFVWHREAAEKVALYLQENLEGIDVAIPIITGAISVQQRAEIAKSQRYVVATLASLSEGVDLSHARTVIFAEEYWQPAMMFQALSRVRRWSNDDRPVLCHYLIAALPSVIPGFNSSLETIDTVIHKAHKDRHSTIEGIMKQILED